MQEESKETLVIPEAPLNNSIEAAKQDAIKSMEILRIDFDSCDDEDLISSNTAANGAILNDGEDAEPGEDDTNIQVDIAQDESVIIQDDLSNLRLQKSSNHGLPLYEESDTTGQKNRKAYSFMKKDTRSPFVAYRGK